jgi:hypothetical protein
VLPSVGNVSLLAVEVSVALLGPCVCRVTCKNREGGIETIGAGSSEGNAERTKDHRNDPIANLRGEASVSVE